jgi:hypothetical protein
VRHPGRAARAGKAHARRFKPGARTCGGDQLHDLTRAAVRAHWQAAADDLAHLRARARRRAQAAGARGRPCAAPRPAAPACSAALRDRYAPSAMRTRAQRCNWQRRLDWPCNARLAGPRRLPELRRQSAAPRAGAAQPSRGVRV